MWLVWLKQHSKRISLPLSKTSIQKRQRPLDVYLAGGTILSSCHHLTPPHESLITQWQSRNYVTFTKSLSRYSSTNYDSSVEIIPNDHETKQLTDLREIFSDSSSFEDVAKSRHPVRKEPGEETNPENHTPQYIPTPLQAHTIPLLTAGYDVLVNATGTQATTSLFALPLLYKIQQSKASSSSSTTTTLTTDDNNSMTLSNNIQNHIRDQKCAFRALVLAPTPIIAQEFAQELETTARTWATSTITPSTFDNDFVDNLRITLATGGSSVFMQRQDLQSADIIVGTPTRILQFLREKSLLVDAIQQVIVVEADRHLVASDASTILAKLARWLPLTRQSMVCSATFPVPVQNITREFLKPSYYFVAGVGRVAAPLHEISQKVLYVKHNKPEERNNLIADEVEWYRSKHPGRRVLVFADDRKACHAYGGYLKHVFPKQCKILTGGDSTQEREKITRGWLHNKFPILVATDWIVQQMNLPPNTVGLVLQAEVPNNIDKYIYRVQMAGRFGYSPNILHDNHTKNDNNNNGDEKDTDDGNNSGCMATAILDDKNVGVSAHLVSLLESTNQHVPAWLLGMSYIQRKRCTDMEEKIKMGGGSLMKQEKSVNAEELFHNHNADTSQKHVSLSRKHDPSDYTYDVKPLTILDTLKNMPKDDDDFDSLNVHEVDDDIDSETKKAAVVNIRSPQFVRQDPSKELLERYSYVTGTIKLSRRPSLDMIAALSRAAGVSPQVRFEYIGMFPYKVISPFLKSRAELVEESLKLGTKKILIVAEKPWGARAIAEALSGSKGPRQRRGVAGNLPVYYFKTNRFKYVVNPVTGNPTTVFCEVTSVDGHLFSFNFQDKTLEEIGRKDPINPSDYFRFAVVKKAAKDTERLGVVEHLRSLAVGCSHLVLFMDNDDEGENIGHEVIALTRKAFANQVAKERRQNPDAPVVRRVHSLKTPAVRDGALIAAFRKLDEPDSARARAFDARAEIDLRLGVALTRLLTWRCIKLVKNNFSPSVKVVSYGTCHTPILSTCVSRAREIQSFEPTLLAKVNLEGHFDDDPGSLYKLHWITGGPSSAFKGKNLTNEEQAAKAKEIIDVASYPGSYLEVVETERISEHMRPPAALNISKLLSSCSRLFGISTKETLVMADRLYNEGFISFPRTETSWYGPDDFDVVDVLRSHQGHPVWGRTINFLLRTKYNVKSAGPPSDGREAGTHPPIVCIQPATRIRIEKIGGELAWIVYEFIVRHFLGTLSDDLYYTRTVAKLELRPGPGYTSNSKLNSTFELEHLSVDSLGFARPCKWIFQELGPKYSNFIIKKGMKMSIDNINCEFRPSKPPSFFEEYEFIEKMAQEKVGADGNLATYVQSLADRNYISIVDENGNPIVLPFTHHSGQERSMKRFLMPTSLGMALIDLFQDTAIDINDEVSFSHFARVDTRSRLEAEFRQIAAGHLDKRECLERNLNLFQKRFERFEASLTRARLDKFAASLRPLAEDVKYWKELGAFGDLVNLDTMEHESSQHPNEQTEIA